MNGLLAWAALSLAAATQQPVVGLRSIEIEDPARADAVSPDHRRRWRVDLYYPARRGAAQQPEPYAPDAKLVADMAERGYYDVPARTLRNWTEIPGAAYRNAAIEQPDRARSLITIAPGSGVAAFNYSRLAAALVQRGHVVAVIDLPYAGISRLSDGRILRAGDFAGLAQDDPRSWRPAVRAWSADVSKTLDRLLGRASPVRIDRRRIVVTGHSLGGTVALQACRDDPRVRGCGDFEGAPEASDTFDEGSRRPLFITASRSAKPDRPFLPPDLSEPFWSHLKRSGPSAWAIAITKASHMSYSDSPYVMPDTLTRFGGDLMSPDRTFQALTGLVDAFARSYAPGGGGHPALRRFIDRTPEMLARRVGDSGE